ncbi:MAG: hypothetical protein EOM54_09485 [Clostridia bacterium]|nr:hypothetical protein [Clostridia bacterium]
MNSPDETKWTKLDNASRLFPSTYTASDTKVFRFYCELNEPVDPEILQAALTSTVENFPLYKSILRRGIFWFYLESSRIKLVVGAESLPVCAPIYLGHKRNLLFRVFHYNHRINLEVFHVLSDGTGALWFMQSLVYHYLMLAHGDEFAGAIPPLKNTSVNERMDDSFYKHYSGIKKDFGAKHKANSIACRVRGTKLPENRTALIESTMSATAVLLLAHKYNTTLTVFVAALLIRAIGQEIPAAERKRPIVLSVPINLRTYFNSATARNFFSTMNVSYNFGHGKDDLETIIKTLDGNFRGELTEERIAAKLDRFVRLARNPFIRILPLQLKNLFLRIGARRADRKVTAAISNVGRIAMPPEFDGVIRQFGACVGGNYPKLILCTHGDRLAAALTSPFRETDVQRAFFRSLSEMGIDIEISSNL